MAGIDSNGLYQESGYRIRYQESRIGQIEKDHADVVRLWEKQQNGTISMTEEKELWKIIYWLKKELNQYKTSQKMGIEGSSFGGMHAIEDDLIIKERILQNINPDY